MPKISVVIPVYNVERYIERCASSLFSQTLDDIEYIFVDDCSPDKSIDILKKLINKYQAHISEMRWEVKLKRLCKNSGLPAARKLGLDFATGEYIIHCDSDDWVDSMLYQQMYEKAIIDDADIVVSDFITSDGIHNKVHKGLRTVGGFLSDMMYSKVTWSLCNKLIKKTVYNKGYIVPQSNVGEDMAVILQLAKNVTKIAYVENVYYYYYYNPDSTMNVKSEELIYERYRQMRSNVNIVCDAYSQQDTLFKFAHRLSAIKLNCQVLLIPILNEKYRKEWQEINNFPVMRTLFDLNVRLRYKIIIISYYLGVYHMLKKIKKVSNR